ncbi:hypothetical protein VTL71DRAFT_13958 [Oculimacula yallundae]|uniref:Uncharacterized protein n=1 Tax=Oculimacula yallundae TaxID=86028 RepID=A0ABR4CMF5_9HELO
MWITQNRAFFPYFAVLLPSIEEASSRNVWIQTHLPSINAEHRSDLYCKPITSLQNPSFQRYKVAPLHISNPL